MLRACLAATPFVLGLPAFAQQTVFPSPIEPAGQGKLQCYSPDVVKKTCQSMAAYRISASGGFENPASILLPIHPVTTMEIVSPVTIRDGQICGFMRKADLDKARFIRDGAEEGPEVTANYRQRAALVYESILDHEICTAYIADGDGLTTKVTVDGEAMSGPGQRVIWVSPSDGYRVGR